MKIDKIIDDFCVKEPLLDKNKQMAKQAIRLIVDRIYKGAFIFTCGNGGSASDSMHIVGELRKKFLVERQLSSSDLEQLQSLGNDLEFFEINLEKGIPAFSLCSEAAFFTAWLNDKNQDFVFAQQIFVLGRKGDLFFPLSTSGNSKNVCLAAKVAKAKGLKIISFTGARDSELSKLSDFCFRSSSTSTPFIQEDHIKLYHLLCYCMETAIFSKNEKK